MESKSREFEISEQIKEKLKHKDILNKEFSEGKMIHEIMGFSYGTMEKFCKVAFHLLEEKRYEEASNAFLFLVSLNHHCDEYWIGLGISTQLCNHYEEAIDAYEMAAICRLENPTPYFYIAKCLFAIHDRQNALQAIDLAIEYSQDQPEYEELYRQAIAAKKTLLKNFQ